MANVLTRIRNNQITDATITNVKLASSTITGDLMAPNLTFNSNLVLNGNLTVTGNISAQNFTGNVTISNLTTGAINANTMMLNAQSSSPTQSTVWPRTGRFDEG